MTGSTKSKSATPTTHCRSSLISWDISVRKGRIDVDVPRPNLIDAFVQGQVDSPPRTVKKAVPVEVHHRPEGFDRGFVHIEKADARNIRRIDHRFDILHKITKNPASSDAPEQTF